MHHCKVLALASSSVSVLMRGVVCEPAVLETASCFSSARLMSSMWVSADPGSNEALMKKGRELRVLPGLS